MMKRAFNYLTAFAAAATMVLTSCDRGATKPGYEFMPDMYRSPSYETYSASGITADGKSAMDPVKGTIARGYVQYDYPNTQEGYDAAKAELKSPFTADEKLLAEGKQLYGYFCTHCHGEKGDGQGHLVQIEKILGVPSYDDAGRAITPGSTYHVMYYGKGVMGSHASQMTYEERWKVIEYVMYLKAELEKK
jgi:mono/diheme cytochrome c family protein